MASVTSPPRLSSAATRSADVSLSAYAKQGFQLLGSLKLTVALFAFSLLLVFAGTLAQHHLNMYDVKLRYFTSWIAWLHFEDLVPPSFYMHSEPFEGKVPIPGGALVGLLLMLNLVAAKVTRFHVHASGARLWGGVAVIFGGLLLTLAIVSAGQSSEGLQGEPPMTYERLWALCLGTFAALWIGAIGLAITAKSTAVRLSWGALAVGMAAYLIFSLTTGHRIGDPGLRIVWQLTKGLGAGFVLLIGCLMVFQKQGGNVLLHFGVGLLMFGQFLFGDRQSEQRLTLLEGQSASAFVNLDQVEMTFLKEGDGEQQVIAIPSERLKTAAGKAEPIRDPALPVDVRVLAYFPNSRLKAPAESDEYAATQGLGLQVAAVAAPSAGGTSSDVNVASAYVELLDRESGESLGTHLISQRISDLETMAPGRGAGDEFDQLVVGEDEYKIGLRFARNPKPFWVHLSDVRRVDYSGTDTPRDYRSFIRIVDPETGDDRREQIWMNNPLRYRGETYYQSSYDRLPSGVELTGLQVVQNSGWLIPYVACSITALGMCVHFGGTLRRFVRRRNQERRLALANQPGSASDEPPASRLPIYASVAAAALFAFLALIPWTSVRDSLRPAQRDRQFDLHSAGKIPVQFGGRVMPLAAYANQTLKAISNRTSLDLADAPTAIRDRVKGKKRMTPMAWLMEVAIADERLGDLPMFRIDVAEVRDELGLPRRESKLFTLNEIRRELDRFSDLVKAAGEKDPLDQTFKDKKLLELDRRTRVFTMAAAAFRLPVPPEIPKEFLPPGMSEQEARMLAVRQLKNNMDAIERMTSPGLIPPPADKLAVATDAPKWSAYSSAFFNQALESVSQEPTERIGIETFGDMVKAYSEGDPENFNRAVDEHLAAVSAVAVTATPTSGYSPGKVALERWDESNGPTYIAMALYILALVLGCVYLMADLPRLRSSVWGILLVALTIHTLVLLSRIVITGRAPVINLYSSAVFIGWAGVIFGLIQEKIFRYGEGNLLAAGSGVLALLVAHGLGMNTGDTMPVLQAVLDTQFWLGTHVITVTLGYTATMVAGLLGIRYLIAGWLGSDAQSLRQIYRSIYGATCFGILFSFVGTVLGGLWADDSWGRFWGWDPKENGALLIVIWNAMMLHARWDGMAGARGFAILAIGGNIVTAWSYFGTNELGIGMHSYGFTEGVLMWLSVFILTQLAFIIAGIFFSKSSPPDARAA
ncbi:MAG: cytochrome C biogenesis protein [Planctomycetaceae bacterium]|nr:MAG: cytochrome C biogenesis protein [Planctomycetaceae bacterium]